MSRGTCLVTGGAGFIGCALSRGLANEFDRVIALDNLHPQIHAARTRPAELDPRVELRIGDVADASDWDALLADARPDAVVHLAAETGTGQSLTEASRHGLTNVVGTTRMLDALVRHDALPDRIVLTSSRAVYGEGRWRDEDGAEVYPGQRDHAMLEAQTWDFPGLTPTPQHSGEVVPAPANVYAATKYCQENLVSSWCRSFGVTPVVFRLQNVYGPGQSLTNPYTGIVSLFARLAKAGEEIPVYEDGLIIRDFVDIDDVATAVLAGVLHSPGTTAPYDVGRGEATTILRLAEIIAQHYGAPAPRITGEYRNGDVRTAWADIRDTCSALLWEPHIPVDEGIDKLCQWIDQQETMRHDG